MRVLQLSQERTLSKELPERRRFQNFKGMDHLNRDYIYKNMSEKQKRVDM